MKSIYRHCLLLVLMLMTASLALALRPTHWLADDSPPVDLDMMIPKAFGQWHEEPQAQALIVDPQQKETIDRLYSRTLSRTYVDTNNYRIMLSIAYGKDQRDGSEVHHPELCYPAQGFTLESIENGQLDTPAGHIPVVRILTKLGQRIEPVTYWTTVGDRVIGTGFSKKLAEMNYGLRGEIPDGLLFRVSSIDPNSQRAFEKQSAFNTELYGALKPEHREKFFGNTKRDQ